MATSVATSSSSSQLRNYVDATIRDFFEMLGNGEAGWKPLRSVQDLSCTSILSVLSSIEQVSMSRLAAAVGRV